MEWTADVAAGDWLRERLDDPWRGTMHDVVPRGFAAYARVFHPVFRERPVAREWPAEGEDAAARAAWQAFNDAAPEIDTERITWADTASAFGATMHPLAQWGRLIGRDEPFGNGGAPRDAAGWRYDDPNEGRLAPGDLAALARVLAAHTTTPDAGGVAVWEGWGDLVGAKNFPPAGSLFGGMPRRYAEYAPADERDEAVNARHRSLVYRSLKDVFNNPFRKPVWRPGILSDEISRGPRLSLPNRDHVLFRGGISEFAAPEWIGRVPWRRPADEGWFDPASPSIVWPDDRAWVMVTEIDFDSTIVAGTPELVDAIVADPRLEAASIPEGADLSWDSDEVNR